MAKLPQFFEFMGPDGKHHRVNIFGESEYIEKIEQLEKEIKRLNGWIDSHIEIIGAKDQRIEQLEKELKKLSQTQK